MQAALRLRATVLPGKRVEFTAPELPDSGEVELIVMLPEEVGGKPPGYISALDLLDSLPPGPRSAGTWEEVERNFREERDSWDG